jgi:hypothetical protein
MRRATGLCCGPIMESAGANLEQPSRRRGVHHFGLISRRLRGVRLWEQPRGGTRVATPPETSALARSDGGHACAYPPS